MRAEPTLGLASATGRAPRPGDGRRVVRAAGWTPDDAAAAAIAEAELARLDGADRARRPRGARAGSTRDGDLVYTASSMPIRDQEAFVPSALPTRCQIPLQPRRQRDRRPDLVGHRRGRGHAAGRRGSSPATSGLYHDMNGLAALRDVERRRCGSSCSTTTAAGSSSSCPRPSSSSATSSRRCLEPRWGSTRRRSPPCTACAPAGRAISTQLADAAAGGTALIEIPVDRRRNVELHRRIADRGGRRRSRALSRPSRRAGSSAPSLTSVSASSASGSRVGDDARAGEQVGGAVAQQSASGGRRRTRRPRRRPSSQRARRTSRGRGSSSSAIACERPLARLAPDGRRRVQQSRPARPRSAARTSWAWIGVARCWMFATLTSSGSGAASTQTD